MKTAKFKQNKLQMLLTCFLSFTMLFSCVTPSVIKAADDDWSIDLNWGDASDVLTSEYLLNVDEEGTYVVKLQATIEYTGSDSKTYGPEEIQIHLSDMYNLTGLDYYNSRYMALDIGAEEKGSGSGKGDWYYTRVFNEETLTNDYVFTNKNTINTSFTSTFQIVFTFYNVREYLNAVLSKDITATLLNNGTTLSNSNTLKFNFQSTKDKYGLVFDTPGQLSWPNLILSKIDSNKWDDYIFINLPIKASFDEIKSNALQAGYHLDLSLPEDVIVVLHDTLYESSEICLFSKSDVSNYTSVKTNFYYNYLYYALALPREKYLNLGTLDVEAKWYGTYIGHTTEELVAQDTITINVNEFDYIYEGELYSSSKDAVLDKDLYQEVMENGYGKTEYIGNTQDWDLGAAAVYYGKPYNLIIGDDLQYFVYDDNSFRKLEDDEKAITYITLYNPLSKQVSYELWIKRVGSDSYQRIQSSSIRANGQANLSLSSPALRYSEMYVKFLNLEETVPYGEYVRIRTRIFDNTTLDNGKKITDCYNLSYVKIELLNDDSTVDETVVMEDFAITNIPGLAEAVEEIDHADGDTKLRATDKKTVNKIFYQMSTTSSSTDRNVTSDTENIYITSGVIEHYLDINASLASTIEKYDVTYTYPATLTLDIERTKFGRLGDNSYNALINYSLDEVQELDFTKISYSTVDNNDGTVSTTFHFDLTDERVEYTTSYSSNLLYAMNLAFFTSVDDYYLLDLEGEQIILIANAPESDTIYNIYTEKYYSPGATGSKYIYLYYPNIARNSYQGIDKLLAVGDGEYSSIKQKVEFNEEYKYKLRISSSETQMANIVLYDQLENAETSSWNGLYQGYSLAAMQNAGVDTSAFKIYYSASREQTQDLSTSGWVSEDNWTDSLTNVKSIAFDLNGYVMQDDDIFYVEILMKAPSSGAEGEVVKNKTTISYVEYDLSDTVLTNPLKTTTNLPSNTTALTLGDTKIDIHVSKVWDDNNNSFSIRPDSVTVRLFQNDVEIDSAELNTLNNWETTFEQLLKFDKNENEYIYTLKEDNIKGYKNEIQTSSSEKIIDFTVINSVNEDALYVDINGTKMWDDYDNSYGIRPDSVAIELYQDDVKIKSVTTNAAKEWKYTFENLPIYKSANVTYDYQVKEQNVINYEAEYSYGYQHNGLAITFNNNCETENRYDYLRIYYKLNGKTYVTNNLTGTSFAGKTFYIPSHDFYLYWYSDYSASGYYGFKIDSIESCEVDTDSLSYTTSSLPYVTTTELTGDVYPESEHNGYGDNNSELYHYTYDSSTINKRYDITNHLTSLENTQELTIGKKLYVEDIWWAHGNPTFIFKVEGSDLLNNEIVRYVSFYFDEDYVEKNVVGLENQETITQKAIIKLPPGNYAVSEIPVLRYELTKIDAVNASSTTNTSVTFDLSLNKSGECIFTNRCVNYKNYSHNDLVINSIVD